MGVPWRLAFALGDDGWLLRQDIVWSKTAPMPESVQDRCTRAHSYVFMFARQERYFYSAEAIAEPAAESTLADHRYGLEPEREYAVAAERYGAGTSASRRNSASYFGTGAVGGTRNKRSVWTVGPEPFPEAHFATWPPSLVKPLILCSTRPGDTVLDCFSGSGTTLCVARALGRKGIGIELSEKYCAMSVRRLERQTPSLPLDWGDPEAPAVEPDELPA